jgi:hypothetical protein
MKSMNWIDIFTAVASAGTTVGVFLAWWQIKASRQLHRTAFEDSLAREYREITKDIPVKALLGEELDSAEHSQNLKCFYRYIDLTNDQIFLRQQGRVGAATWENWRDGIKTLMSMPAFSEAWKEIKGKPTTKFDELRTLENQVYQGDPYYWEESDLINSSSTKKNLRGSEQSELLLESDIAK